MSNCLNSSGLIPLNLRFFSSANCEDCLDCGGDVKNSGCVLYTGPNLSCSTINSGDTVELAIQKINDRLCAAAGNYATYNTYCLPTVLGQAITTQQQFVETISQYVCNNKTTYDTFVNTTYATFVTNTTNTFNSILNPSITCATAGVTTGDSLTQVLNKYCTKLTSFQSQFDFLQDVVWDDCFTVITTPTTLYDAFTVLLDQICATKALVTNSQLPLFNNSTSCIGGTTSNTLVETIELIKTAVCLRPTFNKTTLTWGCITQPSGATTNLQDSFQTVLTTLNDYLVNKVTTWSSDFTVEETSPGNACAGKKISLATPLNIDRFVAATTSDTSPGTLQAKLEAGTNVTLDYTNPAKAVINCTGTDSFKVKADSSETDIQADFLINKIEGLLGNYGISISESYNSTTKKVDLTPNVDEEVFWNGLYTYIKNDITAKQKFCELVSSCPNSFGAAQVDWTFLNEMTTDYRNRLIITDVTNPLSPYVLLYQTNEVAATTLNGTLNTLLTTPGKILKVELIPFENNNRSTLVITDLNTNTVLTSPLNENVPFGTTNTFTFTLSPSTRYSISATTEYVA